MRLLQDKKACPVGMALLVAVLLSAVAVELPAAGSIRINVLQRAQVDEENILLGRIAEIQADDPILIQKLSSIVVASAPLPGTSRELEDNLIKMRLKQHGFDPSDLMLSIPAKVLVTRSLIEISQEKIKSLVADYIRQNISSDQSEVRIKDIQVDDRLHLPGGHITYEIIPPRSTDGLGKIPFSINFDVNGKFYKRVWATATVEVLGKVVVTRKPLGRHKPITEDDIVLQKMDLTHLPSNAITDLAAVLGKRTRRAVGAKTVLRADLIELPPLVKRGDLVVIVAESEGFKITALGKVKKRGRLGERIPVVNFDSKKILYARVVDANTVAVDF